MVTPSTATTPPAAPHALVARYGVVSREAAHAEGLPGGFTSVFPALRASEEAGRLRRGWLVRDLNPLQFATPGAHEALRAPSSGVVVLAATDPACPWGALLPWPAPGGGEPRRVPGAWVVAVDGEPALYVSRRGRTVLTFPALGPRVWAGLQRTPWAGRYAQWRVERLDGTAATQAPSAELLVRAGFRTERAELVRG